VSPLRLEAIDSLERLEAIEPDWRDLWLRDGCATPFEGPDWLLPWTRHVWGGGKLRVLGIRAGLRLVGLAPLFVWGFGGHPEIVRVSFLGAGISDHLGMIADPAFELEAARLVFDWLAETRDEWHVCDLEELRGGSPLLRTELPDGLIARHAPCSVCPVLTLPRSMNELLETLAPKFRKNLRTAETRLARDGAEFRTVSPDGVEEGMRELFRLHAARWQERRESGMLGDEALQRFHLDAAARLARAGLLRLYTLRLGGDIIAVQYNFGRDGRLFYYLSGFDPAHARRSPGAALLAWTIRAAIDEGATEVDFLRQGEAYKYDWGARDRVNRKLLVSSSAAYARDVA
jgi:CelD/BcsL family acetyltransferase involved in cellulose biosynthesis